MKGLDDQEYDVEVDADETGPPKKRMLAIHFTLQEVGAAMNSSEEFGRSIQAASIEMAPGETVVVVRRKSAPATRGSSCC